MKKMASTTLILLTSIYLLQGASGHGYVSSPRSRQWVAAEDGRWSGGASTLPKKEDCPHCSNTKNSEGFCGIISGRDYDHPKDSVGNPLQPSAQAVYTEGQIIEVDVHFSTNHRGHHMLFGCPDFNNPTKQCFQQHPLEFIEDISVQTYGTSQNANKDSNYPGRGYVDPAARDTRMKFKLPTGLTGNLVLLQWHWVTGNSCRSAGYDDYNWPAGWTPDNMSPCPDYDDLSPTGATGAGQPEQFWNCIEVRIDSSGTTPSTPSSSSNAPVASPVTIPPTASPTASPTLAPNKSIPSSDACCSQDYKTCINDVGWCGTTESDCNSCGQKWLSSGAAENCLARWANCTNNKRGCCDGLQCRGNKYYRQCKI